MARSFKPYWAGETARGRPRLVVPPIFVAGVFAENVRNTSMDGGQQGKKDYATRGSCILSQIQIAIPSWRKSYLTRTFPETPSTVHVHGAVIAVMLSVKFAI